MNPEIAKLLLNKVPQLNIKHVLHNDRYIKRDEYIAFDYEEGEKVEEPVPTAAPTAKVIGFRGAIKKIFGKQNKTMSEPEQESAPTKKYRRERTVFWLEEELGIVTLKTRTGYKESRDMNEESSATEDLRKLYEAVKKEYEKQKDQGHGPIPTNDELALLTALRQGSKEM